MVRIRVISRCSRRKEGHNAGLEIRLVEDIRKHQDEDGIDKIDGCGNDSEGVGFLVHVRPDNCGANQKSSLQDEKNYGLRCGIVLRECENNAV